MSGSNRVASGIFASRIVGLVREVVIGIAMGGGPIADAFRAAMRIPNLLQNLLGEGSISAAFVPVYARLIEEKRDREAGLLARQTLAALGAVVTAIVALIVVGARPLVWATTLGGWSGARYELAISLTRITALGTGFLVLSAWCLGILNANRRYLLSYSAPVIWSAAQIIVLGAVLVFQSVPETGDLAVDAAARYAAAESLARWGAFAMVIGSIGQFAVQVPTVRRVSGKLTPEFSIGPHLREVLTRFLPAVGGRGVVQVSSYVDLALASLLATGAVATLALVMPLYLLGIAVFGFSVAVAELTEMSRTTAGLGAVANRIRTGQRKVLMSAGLITAGAVGGGSIVVAALYQDLNNLLGGNDASTSFTDGNTAVAAATLAAFSLGLPATMVARVSQNALFALGDVKTPARIALVRLGVSALVGFTLMIQFDHLVYGDVVAAPITQEGATAPVTLETLEFAIGGPIEPGPFTTSQVDGFPHWPLWEPISNREPFGDNLADNPDQPPTGTRFAHFGPVGLGLGSAVASWVEWLLLRRRLEQRLGQPVSTGLGRWVAVAGFAAFIAARLVHSLVSAAGAPSFVGLLILGPVVLGTYIGVLWFIGLRPRSPAMH